MLTDIEEKLKTRVDLLTNNSNSSDLLQISLNFLLDPTNYDFQGALVEIADNFGMSPSQLKSLVQGVLVLYGEALNSGSSSSDYLRRKATTLALSPEASQVIISVWETNGKRIANHLLSKIIAKNKLVDLDWSFGVTASSDELDHLGKTYLQLKLTIEYENSGRRSAFIELSVEQFYSFLASLEKCRTFLDYVSPKS